MPNPFYVQPGNNLMPGLISLQRGLQQGQERTERSRFIAAKEEEKAREEEAKIKALEAYKSNDPDKIAEVVINFPETGKTLGQLYDRRRDYNQENYASSLGKLLTEIETTGDLVPSKSAPSLGPSGAQPVGLGGLHPTIAGGTMDPLTKTGEKLTNKVDVVRKIYEKNPEAGKRMIEFEFAKNAPKKYRAWKEVYRPEEKGSGPTTLKKKLDERQKLLDQGLTKDDPRIKAYDRELWPEESENVAPSNLKKMHDERAKLLQEGTDPESDIIKGYNNRILGEAADKVYSPSPLKKLLKERQEFIEEGEDPTGPIVKAYDNRIAGIDIDIEELTPQEIDMWGAWMNLSGKMPSVGRGKQATKIRAAILKSAARQAYEAYGNKHPKKEVTPSEAALDVVANSADTKAIQGSLNYLEKQTASMGSFIQNMDAQIERVDSLVADLPLVDTRLLNVPIRTLHKKILGSPELAKYELYLAEIEREISKLSNAATSSIAAMSVEEIKVWSKIHDKNLSPKDMQELLKETRHAAQLRMESVKDQLGRTREKMRTRDYGGTEVKQPTISSQEEYNALPSGTIYINKNTGKQMRKP